MNIRNLTQIKPVLNFLELNISSFISCFNNFPVFTDL